ncbi:LacI family DNA-binding transcriptional regulator [Fodinicola feengrottensis]|uniref:LacI family DNA-binding transcriptional regulator n=1 Tax=Fodinicola feengrottensis TaxID=435914 RepID=UPI0028BF2073|nr:LacI family DNA-binding transcriptional regulator [Fodinicola feengrottensis]
MGRHAGDATIEEGTRMTRGSGQDRATIRDVAAALAGVSVATVSRVLGGEYPVATATRTKVQRAMRELDFVVNAHARALAGTNTKKKRGLHPRRRHWPVPRPGRPRSRGPGDHRRSALPPMHYPRRPTTRARCRRTDARTTRATPSSSSAVRTRTPSTCTWNG